MTSVGTNNQYIPGIHLSISQLVTLQREANLFSMKPRRQVSSFMAGGYRSRFRGRGMDFDEVRHYQPGDDIRSIDWRVTARTNKVHTKLYREERERPVFICLDQQMSMFFGSQNTLKSVIAAATASIAVWSANKNQDRVGALLFSEHSHIDKKPVGNRKAALSILKLIADSHNQQVDRLRQSDSTINPATNSLNDNLSRLRNVIHPGALVYLFTDFAQFDKDTERHLSMLTRHNDLVIYQINDPLELTLPPQGNYPITNGREFSALSVNSEKARINYQQAVTQRYRKIRQCLDSHGIQLISLLTSSGNSKKLLDYLLDNQQSLHRRSELY